MKTIPIHSFIPREPDPKIQNLLNQYSEFLEEIVNYGSHIMTWKPNDYNKGEQGLPIALFLRNYLSYIDSCSILVKYSSIEPCHSLLRTSFENLLYILYLIDDSSGKKALGYIMENSEHIDHLKTDLKISINCRILHDIPADAGPWWLALVTQTP